MKELGLIVFGWLLGLLGPGIVDAIKKRYQRNEVKAAIDSELSEIQYRLAGSAYVIRLRYGTVDQSFLAWIMTIFKKYSGVYASEQLLDGLERQCKLTEEQLAAFGEYQKSDGTRALTLRKYSTPFLDSHISNASWFPSNLQVSLFELKAQIGILNDLVEEARNYRAMAFQADLSEENYLSVREDLERVYKLTAERSEDIAKAISGIQSRKA